MKHRCPACNDNWVCKNCREKKPYPCDCDNCRLEERFGALVYNANAVCSLCGKQKRDHEFWHCPEKTEWKLRCGARVVIQKTGFDFEILADDAPGLVNFSEIPDLIKILQEIDGRER